MIIIWRGYGSWSKRFHRVRGSRCPGRLATSPCAKPNCWPFDGLCAVIISLPGTVHCGKLNWWTCGIGSGLMGKRMWREWALLAVAVMVAGLMVVPGTVLSQGVEDSRTLVIEGQAGQAPVMRLRGKSYVELEALARLSHGSLSFNGNQVTLTLPGSGANTATTATGEKSEFSKEFLRAGIEEMGMIREWRIALTNAVQNGFPIGDDWIAIYRGPALTNLRLTSVAASTDTD